MINQGGWGSRKHFLDFGYKNADNLKNPHLAINITDTALTIDGVHKRVGIGINTPTRTLSVKGDISFRNDVTIDCNDGLFWHPGLSYGIYRESGSWTHPFPDLRIAFHTGIAIGADSRYGGTRIYDDQNMGTLIASFGDATGSGRYNTYLRGNVGIGTTSAPAAKLEVNGTLKVSSTATIGQENWRGVNFHNGWVNYDNTYNHAGFFKDSLGIVHLKGLVRSGAIGWGKVIFQLPAGYRPAARCLFACCTNPDTIGRIDIETNGYIYATKGDNGWISLDGLTFRAA